MEQEPGRRASAKLLTHDEAWRIAANVAKLPGLLAAARQASGTAAKGETTVAREDRRPRRNAPLDESTVSAADRNTRQRRGDGADVSAVRAHDTGDTAAALRPHHRRPRE